MKCCDTACSYPPPARSSRAVRRGVGITASRESFVEVLRPPPWRAPRARTPPHRSQVLAGGGEPKRSISGALGNFAIVGVSAIFWISLSIAALAQSYPSRPIKLVVPFAAGGPADTLARLTAHHLSAGIGQTVVIDNRPGAGGTIGAKAVVAAEPDGYTLMFGNTATFAVGPAVYASIGYDPIRQFAPIALVSVTHNVLVVNPALPVGSLAELIVYARAHPGKINFASPGHGTPPHMVGEMFRLRAAIDIVHVPYKGTAAALTDIMSGQVELTFENPSVIIPLVQAGKLKGLAVTGQTRNPQAPQLPTMIESGLPDFVSMSFTGLAAPAGTPREIVARLNAAINAGLRSPELTDAFDKLGVGMQPGSAEDFSAFIAREHQRWLAVAKAANIKVD
jgi:tripartite-type tricarboxylate transporter receptor subunit TctC